MTELLRFDVGREDEGLRDELRAALDRVLASGRYLFGPEGDALRSEVLRALDAPEHLSAVGVASGTDAITIALMALGIGPGDEVLTVANAGVFGPTAIRRTGADVVLCDVLPETGTIDPASAAAAVGPRTRAVLAVHLYGNLVDVDALRAALPGLFVIEDCAQAFGGRLR
ncbi:MAG TPA: DegT/DnrJ/EryC1/StrS family aminotransferase, partial [Sandaracinaceae bacterium]